jgi:hypothetical protein
LESGTSIYLRRLKSRFKVAGTERIGGRRNLDRRLKSLPYLLTCPPRDVSVGGWHTLVELKNRPGPVPARRLPALVP